MWHAGTRFDYLYRPALPYGTVVISMATGYEPAKAYHAYTALFYCVGIAGVYLLIRIGMGSRGQPGWPREPRLCFRRRTCCSKISGPMEPAVAAVALGCGSHRGGLVCSPLRPT